MDYYKKYLKYDSNPSSKYDSSENLNPSLDTYRCKYLKYKNKYLNLKNQFGGHVYVDSEKRFIELITLNSAGTDTNLKIYFNNDADIAEATSTLSTMNANVRLDMADVLDVLSENEPIFATDKRALNKICSISWVGIKSTGGIGDILHKTRETMQKRILSGQIDFGVIVFERGPKGLTPTVAPGSKAWVNKTIPNFKPNESGKNAFFIDDSEDHVNSVNLIMTDVSEENKVKAIQKDVKKEVFSELRIGEKDKKAQERNSLRIATDTRAKLLTEIYKHAN
jgi:hypothetical protein